MGGEKSEKLVGKSTAFPLIRQMSGSFSPYFSAFSWADEKKKSILAAENVKES